jgi:hypothetical protein
MEALTWPTLDDDHQRLTAAPEKDLGESNQTPEELRAEARRLHALAAETDANGGGGKGFLMIAANYEIVAAKRLAA